MYRVGRFTKKAQGFTYLGLLFAVAVVGVALAAVAEVWSTASTRVKEQELLFVGGEFQRAIAAYYLNNPGQADRYPKTLDDLLLDPHRAVITRYLRKVYCDPFSGKPEWGFVKSPAGGIMGVYSLSSGKPIKQTGFDAQFSGFENAVSYANWIFVPGQDLGVAPPAPVVAPGPGVPAPSLQPVAPAAPPLMAQTATSDNVAPPPLPRQARNCDQLAQADASACAFEQQRWGDSSQCVASAGARMGACEQGGPLPPLSIRVR